MNQIVTFTTYKASELTREQFSESENAILDTVNQKVAGAETLERIVEFLFSATRAISPCDRIGLAFVSEDGRRLTARYASASYQPIVLGKGYAEDLHGSSLEKVLETGAVRVINDLEQYYASKPQSTSTMLMLREGIRSSMTCPLTVEGRRIGVLFRSSRKANAYDEHQVRLHIATAERLSQAVEKAYRIEQLQSALHAYYEMLGFVSHELKSPLASIVMDGTVLLKGYLGELPPKQREKITQMINKSEFLLGLTREYLDLTRIESGKLSLLRRPDVDFMERVVEPSIDMIKSLAEKRHNRFVRETNGPLAPVECDPELLRIVMVNLLSNAVKYGNEGGEIRVRVEDSGSALRVEVWNEGPGFPETEKPRLFHKFSRLQTPALQARKGTGVGLYTAWKIIQLHNGKITAESKEGAWAQFTFELPRGSA